MTQVKVTFQKPDRPLISKNFITNICCMLLFGGCILMFCILGFFRYNKEKNRISFYPLYTIVCKPKNINIQIIFVGHTIALLILIIAFSYIHRVERKQSNTVIIFNTLMTIICSIFCILTYKNFTVFLFSSIILNLITLLNIMFSVKKYQCENIQWIFCFSLTIYLFTFSLIRNDDI